MADTSIRVSEELADELHDLKNRGDTYEDVIWRLLRESEEGSPEELEDVEEEPEPEPDSGPEPTADIEEILSRWNPQGSSAEQRREAGRAVLEYVRDHGRVTKNDLMEDVYPEHQVETQSQRTWWRTTARGDIQGGKGGALACAIDAGAVEFHRSPPGDDEPHRYEWIGETDE